MKSDYWEENDQVFCHHGKRYGISQSGKTVCVGEVPGSDKVNQYKEQPIERPPGNTLDTPAKLSVTFCIICGSEVPGKRKDRMFCSPSCRKTASRKGKQLKMAGVS